MIAASKYSGEEDRAASLSDVYQSRPQGGSISIPGEQSRRLLHDQSVQQYPEAARFKQRSSSLAPPDGTRFAREKTYSLLGGHIAAYDEDIQTASYSAIPYEQVTNSDYEAPASLPQVRIIPNP